MYISNTNEAIEQESLFRWIAYVRHSMPELDLLFHIPNGGKRAIKTAKDMKRQGVKAGIPDLFLPVAKSGYHGLWIEMKKMGGKVSKNQKEWLELLSKQGYMCEVCYGWEEAQRVLTDYLKYKM